MTITEQQVWLVKPTISSLQFSLKKKQQQQKTYKKLKDVQLPSFFQTPETTPFNSSLALRVLPATDLIHPITHTLIQCFFLTCILH